MPSESVIISKNNHSYYRYYYLSYLIYLSRRQITSNDIQFSFSSGSVPGLIHRGSAITISHSNGNGNNKNKGRLMIAQCWFIRKPTTLHYDGPINAKMLITHLCILHYRIWRIGIGYIFLYFEEHPIRLCTLL
jgi:hypothetical protein